MSRLCLLLALLAGAGAHAADAPALALEYRIPLGDVKGRIDHLAVDVMRQRLYVAELGNDSLGVVDLATHAVLHTITGFSEPQGVGYEPRSDTLFVSNAGDGSVSMLRGADLARLGSVDLGADADNIRVDTVGRRVYVGHGNGAIAVIDAASRQLQADIHLDGHPEGFQLDAAGTSIWINVPDSHEIVVADGTLGRQVMHWPMTHPGANFPMAFGMDRGQLVAVFRRPDWLGVFESASGRLLASADTCGDADDVYADAARHRLYVSCGAGFVEVFDPSQQPVACLARIRTARGARTALYSPELGRYYLAVPASAESPASIWVFRPMP